jgi:hypothetical protein
MKVISYTALHYGSDYLGYAIRSVIDHVDQHWILYSDVGSHGHRTDAVNPDTREQLMDIAIEAAGDKLGWIDGKWDYEGAQRETIHQIAADADVILVVDADEVWSEDLVKTSLSYIRGMGLTRNIRLPIIHYWRSFYRCVLHDPAFPIRIILPKNTRQSEPLTLGYGQINGQINHFGYAQRPAIVEYKHHTHGHKGEWRKDVDWFNDIFMANRQTDTHPVGSEYWNPEAVDPWQYLPDFMRQHPFANMETIE